MNAPVLRLIGLTSVVLLGLSACSDQTARVGSEAEKDIALQSISTSDQVSKYDYSGAEHALALQCIRDKGYEVESDPYDPTRTDNDDFEHSRGLTAWFDISVDTVEADIQRVLAAQQANLNAEPLEGDSGVTMSDEAGDHYYGTQEKDVTVDLPGGISVGQEIGGCVGEGLEELYGTSAEEAVKTSMKYYKGPGTLWALENLESTNAVAAEYVACMDKKGFTLPDPATLPDELYAKFPAVLEGTQQLSALDEPIAKFVDADTDCKNEHSITGKFAAIYVDHMEESSDERERIVAAYQQMTDHADKVIEERFVSNS